MTDDMADPVEEFTIDGRTYRVSELRMGGVNAIRRFLSEMPRPKQHVPAQDFAGVAAALTPPPEATEGLSPEARIRLLENAQRQASAIVQGQLREARAALGDWPPDISDPRAMGLIQSAEGGPEFLLWVCLRQHNPEVDRREAARLLETIPYQRFMEILSCSVHGPQMLRTLRGRRRRILDAIADGEDADGLEAELNAELEAALPNRLAAGALP